MEPFDGVVLSATVDPGWPEVGAIVGIKLGSLELNWHGNSTVTDAELQQLVVPEISRITSLDDFVQGTPGNYDWSAAQVGYLFIRFDRDAVRDLAGIDTTELQVEYIILSEDETEQVQIDLGRHKLTGDVNDGHDRRRLPRTGAVVEGDTARATLDVTLAMTIPKWQPPAPLGVRRDIARPLGDLWLSITSDDYGDWDAQTTVSDLVFELLDNSGAVIREWAPRQGEYKPSPFRHRIDSNRLPGNALTLLSGGGVAWIPRDMNESGYLRSSSGCAVRLPVEGTADVAAVRFKSGTIEETGMRSVGGDKSTWLVFELFYENHAVRELDPPPYMEVGATTQVPSPPTGLTESTNLIQAYAVAPSAAGMPPWYDADFALPQAFDVWGMQAPITVNTMGPGRVMPEGLDLGTVSKVALVDSEDGISVCGGTKTVPVPEGPGRVLWVFLNMFGELSDSTVSDFELQFNIDHEGTTVASQTVRLENGRVPPIWRGWSGLSVELDVGYTDTDSGIEVRLEAPSEIPASVTAQLVTEARVTALHDLTVEEMRGVDALGSGGSSVDQEPQWTSYVNTAEQFESVEVDTRFQMYDGHSLYYLAQCDPTANRVLTKLKARATGALIATAPSGGMPVYAESWFAVPRVTAEWRGMGAPPEVDELFTCNQGGALTVIPIYYGHAATAEFADYTFMVTDMNGVEQPHTVLGFFGQVIFIRLNTLAPSPDWPWGDEGDPVGEYHTVVARSEHSSFAVCVFNYVSDEGQNGS